jgi:hypothetical protein
VMSGVLNKRYDCEGGSLFGKVNLQRK